MNRLLIVRCPDLLDEDEGGAALRLFAEVVEATEAFCPWVTAVRTGICSLPARGPARYFGGEGTLVQRVTDATSGITPVEVGVADGLFAAVLAARGNLIVPVGGTAAFLAPLPVGVLGRPELTELLGRLGIRTLGDFAALPESHVLGRFGADGAVCHEVAGGRNGELGDLRRPAAGRSADARRRGTRRDGGPASRPRAGDPEFWGGVSDADARAARALAAVQDLLGPDGVVTARLQGGRGPAQRARFVTWNDREGHEDASRAAARGPVRSPRRRRWSCIPPPPGRAGGHRRPAGIGVGARPAHRHPGPAVGGGGPVVGGDRLGRAVALRRAVVVEVPPEERARAGGGGHGSPSAPDRTGPVVGRSDLRMTGRPHQPWPTPNYTPTPISPSSTGPATPRSWPPAPSAWAWPRWP